MRLPDREHRSQLYVLAFILCFLLAALCGCSTAKGKPALGPLLTTTNAAPVIVTNTVTEIVPFKVTNAVNEIVIRYVTNQVSLIATNWQTNIITQVNPVWQQTIDGAKAVNSTLNPTPTAPFVNIGLTALSGVLGWFAAFQNRKREKAEGDRASKVALLNTVIAGVEAFNDPAVKKKVAETAKLWGTRDALASHVAAVTGPGPNPI